MNPTAVCEEPVLDLPPMDELMQWELRIAQRADQLVAGAGEKREKDLVYWLQAEREVLAHLVAAPVEFAAR
jgi:hypothetical protein